ncbi:hypothetical protein Aazo_5347 (plasmid) ['Nostoc azollae' 0708]|jgi:hypothetical protein|uniref:Uncharacterized protein n=1 Tax=Nostoc azollae (strain 0708) TaxID=551115 RepID=D7E5Q3_NOSA0|nr:hypothetical protein Aazo_5347 ['Nostoc azollae' 0708]
MGKKVEEDILVNLSIEPTKISFFLIHQTYVYRAISNQIMRQCEMGGIKTEFKSIEIMALYWLVN